MDKEINANVAKAIAITQAVVAPGLMVFGAATHNTKLLKVGAVWCGLIALDSARTTCDAIENLLIIKNLQNENSEKEM